mgnify:FL=1
MIDSHLVKKGWATSEAERALHILSESPAHKTPALRRIDATAYWIVLIVAILGNFLISIVLIPFLLIMDSLTLIITLILFGS